MKHAFLSKVIALLLIPTFLLSDITLAQELSTASQRPTFAKAEEMFKNRALDFAKEWTGKYANLLVGKTTAKVNALGNKVSLADAENELIRQIKEYSPSRKTLAPRSIAQLVSENLKALPAPAAGLTAAVEGEFDAHRAPRDSASGKRKLYPVDQTFRQKSDEVLSKVMEDVAANEALLKGMNDFGKAAWLFERLAKAQNCRIAHFRRNMMPHMASMPGIIREIEPRAPTALLIAGLFHDINRFYEGYYVHVEAEPQSDGPEFQGFKAGQHSEEATEFAVKWLETVGIREKVLQDVRTLILHHETGISPEDAKDKGYPERLAVAANILQRADGISQFIPRLLISSYATHGPSIIEYKYGRLTQEDKDIVDRLIRADMAAFGETEEGRGTLEAFNRIRDSIATKFKNRASASGKVGLYPVNQEYRGETDEILRTLDRDISSNAALLRRKDDFEKARWLFERMAKIRNCKGKYFRRNMAPHMDSMPSIIRELEPQASAALLIAGLFHSINRFFEGYYVHVEDEPPSDSAGFPGFKASQHSEEAAKFAVEWLKKIGISAAVLEDVKILILHQATGISPELAKERGYRKDLVTTADILQRADAISQFIPKLLINSYIIHGPSIIEYKYACLTPEDRKIVDRFMRKGMSAFKKTDKGRRTLKAFTHIKHITYTGAVESLRRDLKDIRWGVRQRAAWSLGRRDVPGAVEFLAKVLIKDPVRDVRRTAAEALGYKGDKNAVNFLIMALNTDDDKDIRIAAIRALGSINDPSAIGALTEASKDEDPYISQIALQTRAKITRKVLRNRRLIPIRRFSSPIKQIIIPSTIYEKGKGFVRPEDEKFAKEAAKKIAAAMRDLLNRKDKKKITLVLAPGVTVEGVYRNLAKEKKIDWKRVHVFQTDEIKGLPPSHPASIARFLGDNLLKRARIPKKNIHYIDGTRPKGSLDEYTEELAKHGGADIVVLGTGMEGQLVSNPKGSSFKSRMRKVRLDESFLEVNKKYFESTLEDYEELRKHPYAYTMGLADIFEARQIFFLAKGYKKANILREAFMGPVTKNISASMLQRHSAPTVILDTEAAALLKTAFNLEMGATHRISDPYGYKKGKIDLESLASGEGIRKTYVRLLKTRGQKSTLPKKDSINIISRAVMASVKKESDRDEEDKVCLEVVLTSIEVLAKGLVEEVRKTRAICKVVGNRRNRTARVVLVGGAAEGGGDFYLKNLQQKVNELTGDPKMIQIIPTTMGDEREIIGAVEYPRLVLGLDLPTKKDAVYAVGVDLGGTNIRAAVVNLRTMKIEGQPISIKVFSKTEMADMTAIGNKLRKKKIDIDNLPSGLEGFLPAGEDHKKDIETHNTLSNILLERMGKVIELVLIGFKRKDIGFVGVALPGIFEEEGPVKLAYNVPITGVDVIKKLRKKLGLEVYAGNDVACGAVGEIKAGTGKKFKIIYLLNVGTGLTMCLVHKDLSAARPSASGSSEKSGYLLIENGTVVMPDRVIENGAVLIRDGKIEQVGRRGDVIVPAGAQVEVIDATGKMVGPGFIDLHIHGAADVMPQSGRVEDVIRMAQYLYRFGVTRFFPTAITAPMEELLGFLEAVRQARMMRIPGVGPAHIEGPWINKETKGAQPEEHILVPRPDEVREFIQKSRDVLRILTLAPEVFMREGVEYLIKEMFEAGIIPSAGHFKPTEEEAKRIFELAAALPMPTHVTHAFNGTIRDPFLVDGLLAGNFFLTVVLDMVHMPIEGAAGVRRIFAEANGMTFITDALNAGGLVTSIGNRVYKAVKADTVDSGKPRGPGTAFFAEPEKPGDIWNLGGSRVTMDEILRNAMEFIGLRPWTAIRALSENAVRAVGDKNRGAIMPGKKADIVILDKNYKVTHTIIGGEVVYPYDVARASTSGFNGVQSVNELLSNIKETVEVTKESVVISNPSRFRDETVDYLAFEAGLNQNPDVKQAAQRILREAALIFNLKLASIHEFYMAKKEGKWARVTVPAVNGRTDVYHQFQQLFRAAKEKNVGALILEVARSEMRYSGQDAGEFTAVSIASAIRQGYEGLLFAQGDHYQVNKEKYAKGGEDREKELSSIESLIRKTLLADMYNIDLDASTLVDEEVLDRVMQFENGFVDRYLAQNPKLVQGLDDNGVKSLRRKLVDYIEMGNIEFLSSEEKREIEGLYRAMHQTNIEVTMRLIRYIRALEKELGLTVPVSIGIEERHIDSPKHKNNPSTVLGSMTLAQTILGQTQAEGLVGPSKISLQTGTMHGVGGEVDFGIYQRHLEFQDRIGLAVFVQHGASTLEKEDFDKMREGDVGEVHLATEYQKIEFGIVAKMMPELAESMAGYLEILMGRNEPMVKKFLAMWNLAFGKPELAIESAKGDEKKIAQYKELTAIQSKKSRQEIIAEILGDFMPKGLKGTLKDLVKELSAPFKQELWNLPKEVRTAVDQALYEEFSTIFEKLGAENTKAVVEEILPFNKQPAVLPDRPSSLSEARASAPRPIDIEQGPRDGVREQTRDSASGIPDVVSILEAANYNVKNAAGIINLNPVYLRGIPEIGFEGIMNPEKVVRVQFPVRMDDGTTRIFYGFRAVHSTARGAAKGGIRLKPDMSLAESEEGLDKTATEAAGLSSLMTWKTGVANIPYGGSKGDIIVNPKELSEGERARLMEGYAQAIPVGPLTDIPAPDQFTNSRDMAAFAKGYKEGLKAKGVPLTGIEKAVVTGKPVSEGGSRGRTEATGRGQVYVTSEIVKYLGERFLGPGRTTLKGAAVAVQGYGNVGFSAAKFFAEEGARIVAISNSLGAIYNENGIDLKSLNRWIEEEKDRIQREDTLHRRPVEVDLSGFAGGRPISGEELLELDVDILAPDATQNVITAANAPRIRAKIISEGANNPTTPAADEILKKKGVLVIPDILTNSGGVIVSYYEWVQNLDGERWRIKNVRNMLAYRIKVAAREVMGVVEELNTTLREAAYIIAIIRVVNAEIARNPELYEYSKKTGAKPYDFHDNIRLYPETIEELILTIKEGKLPEVIRTSEWKFQQRIGETVLRMLERFENSPEEGPKAVLLAGPATVGKESIQHRIGWLIGYLAGNEVHYLDTDVNPPETLEQLMRGERVHLRQKRGAYHTIQLDKNDILIAEGSNTITYGKKIPLSRKYLLFTHNIPNMKLADNRPLSSVNLRLMGEILDAEKRANEGVSSVLKRWHKWRGDEIGKVYDQWDEADETIDTYMPYDILVMKRYLEARLKSAKDTLRRDQEERRQYQIVERLLVLFKGVPAISDRDLRAIPSWSDFNQILPGKELNPVLSDREAAQLLQEIRMPAARASSSGVEAPEAAIASVEDLTRQISTRLLLRPEGAIDLSGIAVVMLKDLPEIVTGKKGAVIGETLKDRYSVMKQGLRKLFAKGEGLAEAASKEELVIRANEFRAKGLKVIILGDNTVSSLGQNEINGKAGEDWCAVTTDSTKDLGPITVPFINLNAMTAMGIGILYNDVPLFQMAYKLFTGEEAQQDIISNLRNKALWIIKAIPRIVKLSIEEFKAREELRKLFAVAA